MYYQAFSCSCVVELASDGVRALVSSVPLLFLTAIETFNGRTRIFQEHQIRGTRGITKNLAIVNM